MTAVRKNVFWNIRLKDEMPVWKRAIWRVFGERLQGEDDGYIVIGYRFRNVTLIASIRHQEEITEE